MIITEQQSKRMRQLKADGYSTHEIARMFGCGQSTAWKHATGRSDYSKIQKRKKVTRDYRKVLYPANIDRDAIRLRKEIPRDTRSFTSRFCGDPLPGRSALDKQTHGGE